MTDPNQAATIAEVLRARAGQQADRLAFRELRNDLSHRDSVTYGALDLRARSLGERMSRVLAPGDRALLLIPGAIDYLTALFACFFSGVVAVSGVPAYAPSDRSLRHTARLQRLRWVIASSGASAIIGPKALLARVERALPPDELKLSYITTDGLASDRGVTTWAARPCGPESIAMLQYTSGSTSPPGGVVLRHRNLSSNLAAQAQAFQMSPSDIGVSWLPLFHDLGLIGAGLLPVHSGFPCILMPAAGFLERPSRWLQCLSNEGGTISWAPNFAYRLCLRAMTPEDRAGLDLSRWRIAMNAAEPVQAETIRDFAEAFAATGFSPKAVYPAYGLAEATLAVSAPAPGQGPHVLRVDQAALAQHLIRTASDGAAFVDLVGCGRPVPGVSIAIVDPERLKRCRSDRVGEIWVSGPGRSEGYFKPEEVSAEDAGVRLAGSAETWLRTGDLGFVSGGDLFITGRLKDLIILRGANIYPQNLEMSAAASHPALREDCACAIPISVDGEEALAIVCEIERRQASAAPNAAAAIRRSIFQRHGLETAAVILIEMGALPKTPSGKVQRRACLAALQAGELPVMFEDRLSPGLGQPPAPSITRPTTPAEILSWIAAWLAPIAPDARIGRRSVLADLGITSAQITQFAADIEAVFGRRVLAAELFELQFVSDLVDRLTPPADEPRGQQRRGLRQG
jgi:acyl-CoA synthetase (AMP-forming)/AMP-acid ligase II